MADDCMVCEGSGLQIVEQDGCKVARPCECRAQRRTARLLEHAQIPRRYEHCTLANFETNFSGVDVSLRSARMMASRFVECYPVETDGKGLLLVGPVGVGKTHIAVGILRALVENRGVKGLFYDYRELLKEVQNSYNPNVAATEMEVLRPVFQAEVLVLDELGASKPTEWVWDTIAHILNSRYNDRRTTIITTNYANAKPLADTLIRDSGSKSVAREDADRAISGETLGDRIGVRIAVAAARDVRCRRYVRKGLQGDGEARQLFLVFARRRLAAQRLLMPASTRHDDDGPGLELFPIYKSASVSQGRYGSGCFCTWQHIYMAQLRGSAG